MQDNQAFRALFTLPPVQTSASKSLIVPVMPTPKNETGDRELDAVLWLRDCIKTAHPVLIENALTAFKQIRTPAKELEKRFCNYLTRAGGGNPMAAIFGGFGFGNLEALARDTTERQSRKDEALARFGSIDALFAETAAETACKTALKGLRKKKGSIWGYDKAQASARFMKCPELVPATMADCLHSQAYERHLYQLRCASVEIAGEHWEQFQEHADFCFRQFAHIKPRTKDEALAVFEHLEANSGMEREEGPAILRNLIVSGWDC